MNKRTTRKFLLTVGSCLTLLGTSVGSAFAGPTEDYDEGRRLYDSGDMVTSIPILKRAADSGYAPAQAVLARILDQSDFDEEAVAYYRKAAAQGNADGQLGLAGMLNAGEGAPRNEKEAREWLTKAANQGHKQAINVMATSLLTNTWSIPDNERNSPAALAWIQKAADNQFLPALEALANAYRNGTYGLPIDVKKADQLAKAIQKLKGAKSSRRGRFLDQTPSQGESK